MARGKSLYEDVALLDQVPASPRSDFEKSALAESDWRGVWNMVGPTIAHNAKLPLQRLLCIAFIEGARHAAAYFAGKDEGGTGL